ncbi:MAG TPA: TadE/TadG family type IV pilus assembly protein [Nevskiaceae bacterium]|nr:TadE/TadG family type IV pilus assembly protein [Nevskiaceae bacterium]
MLPVVEFAFAFLLLLALMHGTIVYGFVSFARQTIDLVAQESAKPAITATTPFSGDGTREVADYAGAAQAHFDKAQSQLCCNTCLSLRRSPRPGRPRSSVETARPSPSRSH